MLSSDNLYSDLTSNDASSSLHERTPLLRQGLPRPGPIISYLDPSGHSDCKAGHDGEEETRRANSIEEAETGAAGKDTNGFVSVMSVLLLGVLIANADTSLVLATSGTISSQLGSLENQSWLVMSYPLAMCAIQPAYGKLSDIFGRKHVLIVAYSFFAAGCALWYAPRVWRKKPRRRRARASGVGMTMTQVVAGRIISGIGGAGMTVLVSIMISDTVPLRDVATWRGYMNIIATIGKSSGGPMGGFLTDTIGWRWSFFIQCPLALLAILLVSWKVVSPPSQPFSSESEKRKISRVDFLGTVTLAVTITCFLTALDLGGQKVPWTHPVVWILLGSSAIFSLAFLLVEKHIAHEPIFPLGLLFHRDVLTAYLVIALQGGAQFALMFVIPLYFQITASTSVMTAGFHLIPGVISNAIGGIISGIIIKRTASYKRLILFSLSFATAGYILLFLTWRGHTNFWESLYISPGGFGMGVTSAAMFVAMAAGVDESQMAIASTGLYLCTNTGSLVGASMASNVLQTVLRKRLDSGLDGWKDKESIIKGALTDLEYVKALKGRAREVVVNSYVQGFEYTHLVSVVFSLLAFLVGVTMRVHDLA